MCTILQQTNKQTYHKKDFCLSYCNFLQRIYNHRTTKTNQKYPSVNL